MGYWLGWRKVVQGLNDCFLVYSYAFFCHLKKSKSFSKILLISRCYGFPIVVSPPLNWFKCMLLRCVADYSVLCLDFPCIQRGTLTKSTVVLTQNNYGP